MTECKTCVIVDGKPRWIVVDENGKAVNKNPSGKELKSLQIMGSQKERVFYTDEELLNRLEVYYEKNGRVPRAIDFPNSPTYLKRFGSWNNALKLAGLDNREKCGRSDKYTDEELLLFLIIYFEENGKVPTKDDFVNNLACPDYQNYRSHFGSWGNALKLVGLDTDTLVKKGILETTNQKGRWVEIIVRDNFEKEPIDLAGSNINSPHDGVCPNGQTYEVKSAKLLTIGKWRGWPFGTHNKDKDDDTEAIQWYYFAAFNEDYTELYHMWRVPGEIVETTSFVIGMYGGMFCIDNMQEYDIIDKFKDATSAKNKK